MAAILPILIFLFPPLFPVSQPQSQRPPSDLFITSETITVETGEKVSVDSGRLTVPESRNSGSQRSVSIPFYRLRSFSQSSGKAIFILAGGPGASGMTQMTQREPFQAVCLFREVADVVVFDQRGAGSAVPSLVWSETFPGVPLNQPATADRVAQMMTRISAASRDYWTAQGFDLSAYNTEENAADVDALRAALGYDQIAIVGGSYGSHLGLHYLRKYPERVTRALFYGVEGPDHSFDKPGQILNAYRRIATSIEQTGQFQGRLPKGGLIAAWETAINRVRERPLKTVFHYDGKDLEVWITPLLVQMAGARSAGSRNNPERWPETILAMYNGDYSQAARAGVSLQTTSAPHAMKYAMDLASGISVQRRLAIAEDPASKILGHLNLDLFSSETAWGIPPLSDSFREPVATDTQVLLIHGTWDTATPIENAREVARYLPNAHLIEVVGGNHGTLYNLLAHWPPAKKVLSRFLSGTTDDLPHRVVLDMPQYSQKTQGPVLPQVQLWNACKSGDLTSATLAIASGADVNQLDIRTGGTGRRPLNWAAFFGHTAIVELLLEHQAQLNATNLSGFTPLHHAVENGQTAVVALLLAAGADRSIANKKGEDPLQTALRLNHSAIGAMLQSQSTPPQQQ